MTAEKFPYTFFCPPGLADQCNSGFSYGPESATQSRERRRIAVVVRELTAYFDAKFAQLEAKVDLATLGLITIANRELESIKIGVQQEQQADARFSPDQTCKLSVPKKDPVTKLVEESLPQQDIRTQNRLAIVEDGAAQRQLSCSHFDISDGISTTTGTEDVLSVEDFSTSNGEKLVGDWRALPAMDWSYLHARFRKPKPLHTSVNRERLIKYFAVQGGPCPGVHGSNAEAVQASKGYKGNRCKKFDDLAAAEKFANVSIERMLTSNVAASFRE